MAKLSVTFVVPHQRPSSGGVYTITEFARNLAAHAHVNLAVRTGQPVPVEGVVVLACETFSEYTLPDADLLIVNADATDAERLSALPASKGRPVLFLQGRGEPDDEIVAANLDRFDVAITGARWLVEEAARHDCRATHVTYGLDRRLFFRGEPAAARPPLVAMMTHALDWKGTGDGLDALDIALQEAPEMTIALFGVPKAVPEERLARADFPARFLPELSGHRDRIGALMRESALFVCASWEEGFGLPGLEALASGAALATTDTKGSRDYAFDGDTALVTPPRRPDLLAASIVALVGDAQRRDELAGRGAAYVERSYPDWPEAAARLSRILEQLAR